MNYSNYYSFHVYNSKMNFYSGTKKLDSCLENYPIQNFSLNFISFELLDNIYFLKKLCPLYFSFFNIETFLIKNIANSFNKKNELF